MSASNDSPIWLVFWCERTSEQFEDRTTLLRVTTSAPDETERPPDDLRRFATEVAGKGNYGGSSAQAEVDRKRVEIGQWFLCAGDGVASEKKIPGLAWPRTSGGFFALLAFALVVLNKEESGYLPILRRSRFWNHYADGSHAKVFKDMFDGAWRDSIGPFLYRDGAIRASTPANLIILPGQDLDAIHDWALPGERPQEVDGTRGTSKARPQHTSTNRTKVAAFLDELLNAAGTELSFRSFVYVPREDIERAALDRIAAGEQWVPIEGDAGTGKTTLLQRLLGELLRDHADAHRVPLFVDGAWLLHSSVSTPLGTLAERLDLDPRSPWDLIESIGATLRANDKELVVLFDTLDAVLLSPQKDRAIRWLRELERVRIQVVSSCRPLEARLARLPKDRRILLHDFDDAHARDALRAYVAHYYRDRPKAFQHDLVGRLERSYLEQTAYADICRRPVTLRMLFDAYDGRPFPEKLDRARLFRDFWEHKVSGQSRPRRGETDTPRRRDQFASELALAMAKGAEPRPWLPGFEVEQLLTRLNLDWTTFDALVSDGVLIQTETRHPPSQAGFFHQSFLEYAAARAILKQPDAAVREARVTEVIAPLLQREGGKPWFALLEELALQAHGATETERVLRALTLSNLPGTDESAGAIWCRVPESIAKAHAVLGEHLASNEHARNECLRHIHDAPAERASELLGQFAAPAWTSGDPSTRFTVLEAWTRAALSHPHAVFEQVQRFAVVSAATEDEHIASRVADLLAAFLGVHDDWVDPLLERFYTSLQNRKSARARCGLIAAVGARIEISNLAHALLKRWLRIPEVRHARGNTELRTAFAEALGRLPPSDSERVEEGRDVLHGNETARRLLSVWRERVRRGLWTFNDLPLAFDVPSEIPLPVWADAVEITFIPLLQDGLSDPVPILTDACKRGQGGSSQEQSDYRSIALRALARVPLSEAEARRILEGSGLLEAPLGELQDLELGLLGHCLHGVPDRATTILNELDTLGLLVRMLEGLPPHLLEDAALILLEGKNPEHGDPLRIARLVETILLKTDALPRATFLAKAGQWAIERSRMTSSWPIQRIAIRVLPSIAGSLDLETFNVLVRELAERWSTQKTDAAASTTLSSLLALHRDKRAPAGLNAALMSRTVAVLLSLSPEFEATRRESFATLHALAADDPASVPDTVDELLPILERQELHDTFTNDAVGILRLVQVAARSRGTWAWDVVRRVAHAAVARRTGRHGWDSVRDVARHVVRLVLQEHNARAALCRDLATMPEMLQAGVVDCAAEANDDVVFSRLREIESDGKLLPTAGRKFSSWGRRRRLTIS